MGGRGREGEGRPRKAWRRYPQPSALQRFRFWSACLRAAKPTFSLWHDSRLRRRCTPSAPLLYSPFQLSAATSPPPAVLRIVSNVCTRHNRLAACARPLYSVLYQFMPFPVA